MQDLNIAAIQANLFWEDQTANLNLFDKLIAEVKAEADIIVLPEMFTTGFTMNTDLLTEEKSKLTLDWMKTKAKEKNAALCGSVAIKEGDKFYNRLYWVNPDGTFAQYDKRHLFSLSHEPLKYTAGTNQLVVEFRGWKICPLICYDLRFPVWARNVLENETAKYDVLIYVANWPEKRIHAWQTLLQARAIENQSYVVGLNRVGKDGNDIEHSGDSMIIDPMGIVLQHSVDEEKIIYATLPEKNLYKVRTALPFLKDGDGFEIKT